MNSFRTLLASLVIGLGLSAGLLQAAPEHPGTDSAAPSASEPDGPWLLAYFRQRYPTRIEIDEEGNTREVPLEDPMAVERLHYALSTDGRNWTPLNDNQPVWDHWLRDPFIGRGPDGRWHLLATGGARHDDKHPEVDCLHAVSDDLLTWEETESLALMAGVRDDDGRRARNIWAPEWFLDEESGEFVLLWSSSFEDAGWKKSRLWFARTSDWETFSPAEVLFDPPYSVIDGHLMEHQGTYHLFHKEEEFGARTGERRAIRVATADKLAGPYEIHEGHLNDGQIVPTITEGCAVMPDPETPGWLLLYDYCMTDRYGVSTSGNLLDWGVVEDVSFPDSARHGSINRLTIAEAEHLKQRFASED